MMVRVPHPALLDVVEASRRHTTGTRRTHIADSDVVYALSQGMSGPPGSSGGMTRRGTSLCWRIGTYPSDKMPTPGPVIAPHRLSGHDPGDAGPSQDTCQQPPGRLPPLADAGPLRRHLSARLLARP